MKKLLNGLVRNKAFSLETVSKITLYLQRIAKQSYW
jgi:hypothetical protein